MARQAIHPGGSIDVLTTDEFVKMIKRPPLVQRIRASTTIALDATGSGSADVYKVPTGMEFAARRVFFTLTGGTPVDPVSGAVALNAAGHWVAYTRSGQIIEYGQPAYGAAVQVPGVQTWSGEQGPYFRNAEVFNVVVKGLTASVVLSIYLEGILRRPAGEGSDSQPIDW